MLQEKALAILKSGKNVFLTGSAGTGKTYVLNQYIEYLKERKITVAITASTGIAATHMNGMTIHSWAGIGVKEHLTNGNLVSMKSKKYLKDHLEKAKVLIIDEISMLHKNQLNLVDTVLKFFKNNDDPFGGIQVVLCGDFFQLPPIGNQGELSRDKFSFMSEAWVNSKLSICYLTKQFRQNDNDLNEILNEIRTGEISSPSFKKLKSAASNTLTDSEPTKLYTHNYDVDTINAEHLATLTSLPKKYHANTKGNPKLIETLKNSVLASEKLELKIGAKVMFVKNNNEKGYVNGSLGNVIGFNDKGFPSVKLLTGKTITTEKEEWSINDDSGKTLATYNQIPLRLAWAITVHKCQGMTLDSAEIDLSKTFERGQGYVALSRLKNIENLKLIGLNEMALKVDSLAAKADIRFQELSAKIDAELTLDELELLATAFIRDNGGLLDKKEIQKNKKKLKEKTTKKDTTYATTLAYLKQKKSLERIAEERGLSAGTIAGHLIKICKDYPKEDLSFYKPKLGIMRKVKKAYDKQPKGKPISLKAIYEELESKIDYDDIKLAIAFIGKD
jgi:ATP-dependent exoDNAse (exonuclease V) alpha subunit